MTQEEFIDLYVAAIWQARQREQDKRNRQRASDWAKKIEGMENA